MVLKMKTLEGTDVKFENVTYFMASAYGITFEFKVEQFPKAVSITFSWSEFEYITTL